jgi:hypothetical protein
LSALELEWPEAAADFSGQIKLEASEDLGTWRELVRAPVVNLHFGGEQLVRARIECPPVQAKFLRLTWDETAPQFALTKIVAETAANRVDVVRSSLTVKGTAAQDPGVFDFDIGGPLPVDRVDLHLPYANAVVRAEVLSRSSTTAPWQSVVSGNFYRLQNGAQDVRNSVLTVPLHSDRYWRVKLLANSSLSQPPVLRVGWVPHRIVFIATGTAPFELTFGNSEAKVRSVPVGTLIPGWQDSTESSKTVRIGSADVMGVHELGGEKRLATVHAPAWRTWTLWSALVIAVGLLAWMAYRLLQEMRRAPQ